MTGRRITENEVGDEGHFGCKMKEEEEKRNNSEA
jgi:hypothetical protein